MSELLFKVAVLHLAISNMLQIINVWKLENKVEELTQFHDKLIKIIEEVLEDGQG